MITNRLPRTVRSGFFEPLFSLKSRTPRLNYWGQLEQTQYLSENKLVEIQQQRFQKLWNLLWRNNTFYRRRFIDYGLTQNSVKDLRDIHKLPIITKKEIRANTDRMISSGCNRKDLLHFKTGGSTGKALDIFITEECSELRNACARRHDRWTGWEPGETIGAVWGNPHLPGNMREKLRDRLVQPFIYLDTMALCDKSVQKFAEDWERRHPTLLFGHAHSLFVLAKYSERIDLSKIRPKGVLSTSMMLLPNERAFIEKVFGCRVTDRYGCEEVSLIGCECAEHNGMHMNIEHLIIEFIKEDGTSAAPGEKGRIVVTDLMNLAMPFVRYNVEDIGTRLNWTCCCGRGLPLMGKVWGRVSDFLIKRDGTKIAGVSVIENTLTKIPGIDQMQIVQENIDKLFVHIVPGEGYSSTVSRKVIEYFRGLFGGVEVILNFSSELKPEASGKYRFTICKIP